VEIKNIPGEPDFDPTPAYADTVLGEIEASHVPLRQVIVQSFYPPNLDEAKRLLPGVETAFLTSAGTTNEGGAAYASARGYTWWSPGWPVTKEQVDQAHGMGLKVVPWTIDKPDQIVAAAAAGVEAVITNDPVMARRALGLPLPSPPGPPLATGPVEHVQPVERVVGSRRARVRRGSFLLRVRVSAALRRTLTATLPGRRVAARGQLDAPGAGTYTVRMRLSAAGRRALLRRATLRLRVLGSLVRLS
jgi:hypothetical protein